MSLKSISSRMFPLAALAVGLSFCGTAHAQTPPKTPEHPITADQVNKMMAMTHAIDRMRDAMHTMIAQQQKAMPFLPAGFWTDFETEMGKIDWVAIATPIYQKYLSQEDGDKIIAFYSTEYGQRSLDSSMAVMLEMNAKGFELGKEIGGRVGEKYAAEIEANIKKAQQSGAVAPPQK